MNQFLKKIIYISLTILITSCVREVPKLVPPDNFYDSYFISETYKKEYLVGGYNVRIDENKLFRFTSDGKYFHYQKSMRYGNYTIPIDSGYYTTLYPFITIGDTLTFRIYNENKDLKFNINELNYYTFK